LIGQFTSRIGEFVSANQYDGVDIDWEARVAVEQYTDFLRRLRAALGASKLLTVAVGNWDHLETVASRAQAQVDHINVMCYDMDNPGSYVWHNAALRQDGDPSKMTYDWRIGALVKAGVARSKIGVGIPFYGRRWTGATEPLQTNGSRMGGWVNYGDLVKDSVRWQTVNQKWDAKYLADYLSLPQLNEFISYNGVRSIQEICGWAKREGFGGFMTYDLSNEFVAAETGDARYPLSSILFQVAMERDQASVRQRRIPYNRQKTSSWWAGGRSSSASRVWESRWILVWNRSEPSRGRSICLPTWLPP
jgi:chitinase